MNPYEILGVSSGASDDEIKAAYHALTRKYHPDQYGDDNPLKELATEKMQQINAAYDQIQRERAGRSSGTQDGSYTYTGSTTGIYADIRRAINARRFGEAERLLLGVNKVDRTAEWHYCMSVVLMKHRRINDAMRELEIACEMDPGNMEYQKAKEMFNTGARTYGSTYYGGGEPVRDRSADACDCCANLVLLDCCCECVGGDLIPCC